MSQTTIKSLKKALQDKKVLCLAPASPIRHADIQFLKSLDLPLIIPRNLQKALIPYHAHSDKERFQLLRKAILDPAPNKILWALRGGYGSARLINDLLKMPKPKQAATFIGFSDLTALHLFFSQHWGWKTIHGAGLTGLCKKHDSNNYQKIADILLGVKELTISDLKPLNKPAKQRKSIQGRLTGGNLCLIQTSIGTPWEIKTHHKILFIEDTGEKGYQIDRMLHHLQQAKVFEKAEAIIFGTFGDQVHSDLALKRFANDLKIPVYQSNQFGHEKHNHPLVYQSKVRIEKTLSKIFFHMHC